VRRKIPILGVEGAGKSSLILTLGQYISLKKLGRVSIESAQVFGEYVSHVAAGKPLPATQRHEPVALEIERIPDGDGLRDVDLVLSTEDIPGQDFRMLVDELHRSPVSTGRGAQGGSLLQRFADLLSASHGFIFVVDLVRARSADEFADNQQQNIWRAYADQVEPIMTGMLLASRLNANLAGKPVFFIFGKRDLHKLTADQVAADFERAMAIPLAQLRGKLINVRQYHVQSAGWGMDSALDELGVDVLLSDLAHAVGAVKDRSG
jgi:hypothetical protein